MNITEKTRCRICNEYAEYYGFQIGVLDKREYYLYNCGSCKFSFFKNFRNDYNEIYNEDYYNGKGADLGINYIEEFNLLNKTIRTYEWDGVLKLIKLLKGLDSNWLDYGCGTGALVRYGITNGYKAIGYDEGWASKVGLKNNIPILSKNDLINFNGTYDFISAIEVVEHSPDPIKMLKEIRTLLKPGGVLLLTTGNAKPWRKNLLNWNWTKIPDVHVSFFEPATLAKLLELTGYEAKYLDNETIALIPDIIKFKVLKKIGFTTKKRIFNFLPWKYISYIVDYRYKLSKIPYGVAIK